MKIRKKFIQLTRYTYPHGSEGQLRNHLPIGYKTDGFGNFYYVIGENPTSMFTCHLDTVSSHQERITHVQVGDIIKTDGRTILGADDKAGMIVLLYMIEQKVPGVYYFFVGEEVGCIGSGKLAKNWGMSPFSKTINKVVSFDRRDTFSIITHQFYERCCSNDFAIELASRLNDTGNGLRMMSDDGGVLTDSAQFIQLVPECTNISVGYNKEHTKDEYLNIKYLQDLCKSVCMINWETLPIKRDPSITDNLFLDYDYMMSYDVPSPRPTKRDPEWPSDYFSYFDIDGVSKRMYISKTQVRKERSNLYDWLVDNGYPCLTIDGVCWDGHTLFAENEDGEFDLIGKRFYLDEINSSMLYVTSDKLSENKYGVTMTINKHGEEEYS